MKFSEMDGVPKDAITQYNGLDIWTFTDGVTFSCGWLTPAGEHIVSERIMDGSATVSAKITRKDGCSLIERFLIITIEKRRFEPPKCVLLCCCKLLRMRAMCMLLRH